MKTKEVVIEGFANVYDRGSNGEVYELYIYKQPQALKSACKYSQVKCKLILEVPEEGKMVYPSDLAEAWDRMCDGNNLKDSSASLRFKLLKKNLFGEGE